MKLFTYGLLRRGRRLHYYLDEAKLVGITTVVGRLATVGDDITALTVGDQHIPGEVYEVPDTVWPFLDRLEGHPETYVRRETKLTSGEIAQVYWWNRPTLEY